MKNKRSQGQSADVWSVAGEFESRIRAMQIQSVVRITPLIALANFLNASIFTIAFRNSSYLDYLLVWDALIVIIFMQALLAWYRTRGDAAPKFASVRAVKRANIHAILLALLWALPPAFLFHEADASQQLLLSSVTSGMMSGGALVLCNIAFAGVAYTVVVGTGGVIALLSSDSGSAIPLAALLLVYMSALSSGVIHLSRNYRARIVAELLAENQKQVISLLLNDFEQHTADVLLELDAELRLRHVSEKLANLFKLPVEELEGHLLIELIGRLQLPILQTRQKEARTKLQQLIRHFVQNKPFKDVAFPVQQQDDELWWSLTARPIDSSGWRGVISDITTTQRAQLNMWHLAHSDAITGLANRHRFREVLEEITVRAVKESRAAAVICIDLDRFKSVNDAYGHSIGDQLLGVVGQRLRQHSREQDLVARIGGDEFGLVLDEVANEEEAVHIARRILKVLQEPCNIDGNIIPVGASLGLAMVPKDGHLPEIVLKHADMALYSAKSEGRGQLRIYSDSISEIVEQKLILEQALRDALARDDQLYLVYQPQKHLRTGRISCLEVLLRWHHPTLGQIPPMVFIPVAEESGLIRELGAWVIEKACEFAVSLPADVRLAVNLSPLQLIGHELIDRVESSLSHYGIPPQRLELEITESVLINAASDFGIIRQLQDKGIRVALDDFGTGYSALSYLRQMTFNKLKIDRSFILEIRSHKDALAIVGAIIDMAKALNIEVVAEGIEDEQTVKLLSLYGCDAVQGFAIAEPMIEDDLLDYLALGQVVPRA